MKLHFATGESYDVRLDRVEGRMCTLRRAVSNKEIRAPAGARMQIIGTAREGFYLQMETPCMCCGLTGKIYGVPYHDVVIDGAPPKPPTKAALEAAKRMGGQAAYDELVRKWKRRRYWRAGDDD